jgi:predicted metalloprotease
MRWRPSRQSRNVEDRRGQRVSGAAKIGGGAGLVILLVVILLGGDPQQVLQLLVGSGGQAPAPS